jgi:hypothetical protein
MAQMPPRTFGMPPNAAPAADLLSNMAGQSARQRADEEWARRRQERPVRAYLGRVLQAPTDERAWRIGAEGEAIVARELVTLARRDPRWGFLHSIPVGNRGSDIDHVVVGPGGVFTLNAKHHPGAQIWVGANTFMVNGHRQPYIRNSRHEAERASRLLSNALGAHLPVHGVIVPVGARTFTLKTPPADVSVVPRMRLAKWLRKLPVVLNEADIKAIFEAARRPSSWIDSARVRRG